MQCNPKGIPRASRWEFLRDFISIELTGLAQRLVAQLRGWIQYFGAFRPSALRKVFSVLNERLARWYTNEYKRYRRHLREARQKLKETCKDYPNLFVHWQYGYTP